MADPAIRLGGQFNMFPSISRLFICWRGPKSIAKLDGELWPDFPLDPPLIFGAVHQNKQKSDN